MALQSTFEVLEEEVKKVGLAVVVNALQQLCFTKAYELKVNEHKAKSRLSYNTGIALGEAVLAVNEY